ncbi:flagellar hook-associated protein FlgK [Novosphingobium cyanobacteriorum]|uniref:Flagellar hook-associated protein 1 n=1 Tax=Novosphingobium cyanobacteriorum TaxID=3024215 RepID=A0ABT6CK43_9SPHN|nr:flagellar hook-associated protein FlgK [Novosphingobium cyanobacteriorum]MDF8334267.1 flagellar hook-associated protein FlgK [Novosphingobium cyanobacteriorum]
MSSDLLSIGASGAKAARIALDVTGQNIANASSEGYIRRTAKMTEVASTGYQGAVRDVSLSGVRISGVIRNADAFRQAEVRRTGSDTARASTEVTGLSSVEAALENSNVYSAITGFEGALQKLKEDTTSPSLRASVIEAARTMTDTFQIASQQIDAVGTGLRFNAADGVDQINRIAGELARTNLRLSRAADASSDQTALLDQRDKLLNDLSQYADITTTFASDGTVAVTIGGGSAPTLVQGGDTYALAMTTSSSTDPTLDGMVTFDVGGAPVTLSGGSLAGEQQTLTKLGSVKGDLDQLARDIAKTVNDAQKNGVDLNAATGANLFTANNAADFALATSDGSKIATAAAGSLQNSRDTTNFDAMLSDLATTNPAGRMDAILFDVSATVSGRTVTRDALKTISDAAATALSAQSGVDLNTEAVNLVRFQQAFQASGRVMQVAADLFDTLLQIR